MKKFLIQAITLTVIIIVAFVVYVNPSYLSGLFSTGSSPSASIGQVKIGETAVNVEVADSPELRAMGLGGRERLDANSGMLFIFSKPMKARFWMKNMKFPLDLIWIRNNEVVDILKNIPNPAPNTEDSQLPVYEPKTEVDRVLEANSGFADSHNIKVGDKVIFMKKEGS